MNPPDVPTAAARVQVIRQQLFMLEAYIALFDRLESDSDYQGLSATNRGEILPLMLKTLSEASEQVWWLEQSEPELKRVLAPDDDERDEMKRAQAATPRGR